MKLAAFKFLNFPRLLMLLAANRLPQLITVGVSNSANLEEISITNVFWRESCYEHGGDYPYMGVHNSKQTIRIIPSLPANLKVYNYNIFERTHPLFKVLRSDRLFNYLDWPQCGRYVLKVYFDASVKMEFQNSAGNINSGLKISKPANQHLTAIQIPTSVTTASFLKHTALTPAQRKYLYSIAASYSTEHVRSLVTQHYMNVQYRCIRAVIDYNHKRDILFEASVASPENDREDHLSKTQSEVSSRSKNKSKISAKHSRKPSLPKNREARSFNTSASTHRKAKKCTSSQTQRRKSPRRARIRLSDKEEEQGGPNDSLSECLSSLSVGGWDGDSLSDL